MYNDPEAVYPGNCTLHQAILELHDNLNMFEMNFD